MPHAVRLLFRVLPLLVCLSAFLVIGCRKPSRPIQDDLPSLPNPESDDALETARSALNKRSDLASCRAALQQFNVFLERNPERKPTGLAKETAELLRGEFGLDADELAETASTTFTLLDAHHLAQCFLLRDAARSLDVDGVPPARQAEAAFAWIVRHIRLVDRDEPPLPPVPVLRRGSGSARERAFAFLALLHQLKIVGCLVDCGPEHPDQPSRRWLAAAVVGADLHLFDPRLGLSLPGPDAAATLAQLLQKPELLGQLAVDPRFPYDLTPDHLRTAVIYPACSLSALAPRMRTLEGLLEGNPVALADDAEAVLRACRAAAPPHAVKAWPRLADPQAPLRVLRRFLTPEDGGCDARQPFPLRALPGYTLPEDRLVLPLSRQQLFEYRLVPWETLPPPLRRLPCNVELGFIPREFYKRQLFLDLYGEPRELLLRGRFDECAALLVERRDRHQNMLRRLPSDLDAQAAAWIEKARALQAELLRLRDRAARIPEAAADQQSAEENVKEHWEKGTPLLLQLMHRSAAEPYHAQITYGLALCKHEQAQQMQNRWRRAGRPGAAESAAVRATWQAAADWWNAYARRHGAAPEAAAALSLYAEALHALDDQEAAAGLLENLAGNLSPLEKTARLYRARRLRTP